MTVIRRSEPITDDEFNAWADAMGLATPNRIAVRRALTREYERGAATTRGAVETRDAALTLLDEFDRYASGPPYDGSPFAAKVAKFLAIHGGQ